LASTIGEVKMSWLRAVAEVSVTPWKPPLGARVAVR
jgi:hypothetical protein